MEALIIGLREGVEALLLLFFLNNIVKSANTKGLKSPIIQGSIIGVIISCILAIIITYFKKMHFIDENIFQFWIEVISVVSICYLVFTMPSLTKKVVKNEMELVKKTHMSLLIISLTISSREAIEVILFNFNFGINSWIFSLGGVLLAFIIVYLINTQNKKINLKSLFKVTTIYVILLCGYLFGHLINSGIKLKMFNLPKYTLYDLHGTIFDTHQNIFGYIFKVITSWPYSVGFVQFFAQYAFTIILFVIYWTLNQKTKQRSKNIS